MFGISFSEILLILFISLVVFGPRELPGIAKKMGKFVSTVQNLLFNLKYNLYHQSGFEQFNDFRGRVEQSLATLKRQIEPNLLSNSNDSIINKQSEYTQYDFLYQPELEFNRQPELFDDLTN